MRSDCFKQLYLPNLYVYSFSYDFLLQLLLYPIPDKPLMGRPRAFLNLDRDELVRNGSSSLTVVSPLPEEYKHFEYTREIFPIELSSPQHTLGCQL